MKDWMVERGEFELSCMDPSAVRKVAASDCFDPVAVMYSAFCWSGCVALRAMMEIRAPFPDPANGLLVP
jgi:hypothetical protein